MLISRVFRALTTSVVSTTSVPVARASSRRGRAALGTPFALLVAALALLAPIGNASVLDATSAAQSGYRITELSDSPEVSSVTGLAVDPTDSNAVYYFNGSDLTLRRQSFATGANAVVDTLSEFVYGTVVTIDEQSPDNLYLAHSGAFGPGAATPQILRYTLNADRVSYSSRDVIYDARDYSTATPPGPNLTGYLAYDLDFADTLTGRAVVVSEAHAGVNEIFELDLPFVPNYQRRPLIRLTGASGAFSVAPDGTVFYAFPSDSLFTAHNQVLIYSWSRSQLDGVRAGGYASPLTESDGTLVRTYDPTPGGNADWQSVPYLIARDERGQRILYAGLYEGRFSGNAVRTQVMRLNLSTGADDLTWLRPMDQASVGGEAQAVPVSPTPGKIAFSSRIGDFRPFAGQWDEHHGTVTATGYVCFMTYGGFPNFPSEGAIARVQPANSQAEIAQIALSGGVTQVLVAPGQSFSLDVELRDAGGYRLRDEFADSTLVLAFSGSNNAVLSGSSGQANASDGALSLPNLRVSAPGNHSLSLFAVNGTSLTLPVRVSDPGADLASSSAESSGCALGHRPFSAGWWLGLLALAGLIGLMRRRAC